MAFNFFGLFSKNPSQDSYAKLVMKELRRAGITDAIEYDKEAFILTCNGGRTYLGNTYADYCHAESKEHRELLLTNVVAPLFNLEKEVSREEALELVVAVVRERAMFTTGALFWQLQGAKTNEITTASAPLSEWFCKMLVLDFPTHVRIVTKEDLDLWQISFEDLFEIGSERLTEVSQPQFEFENGYFVGAWKDDYDGSRVLLPELFRKLGFEGDPVFVLPNRLTLMVADSQNVPAMKAMLEKAAEIVQSVPRPQNHSPLTYKNGALQDFRVPAGSPLFNDVELARKLTAMAAYDEQGDQLQALYEKEAKDYFVATCKVVEKDGKYSSYCVWSKGVPTLLPEADEVMFFDPDQPDGKQLSATVPWGEVRGKFGDLLLDTQMFPPRYYVSAFPPEEELRGFSSGNDAR